MQDRKEQSRAEVAELVEKYQRLTPAQVRAYNEEETKKDFILPLFKALGWDVDQKDEVAAEVSASNGRVDYAFKLRGVPRLYVEAKALGNDLTDARWARQAVTYAYHKGVTWALLSSFSHLKVFNANQSADNPQSGLFLNLTAPEYVTALDRLWGLAKESAEAGVLEDEARKSGRLPPSLPVEKRLFAQLRTWREELFNRTAQYAHEGAQLTPSQVDEIIQRFFNRMIFIRTCEDRDLEEKRLLAAWHGFQGRTLRGRQPLLEEVRRIFKCYADNYDSDLFDHHAVDDTHFDEDILSEILAGLHGVPGGLADYDFSLIDADIMGAVYEQYLGHVAQIVVRRQREAQQRMQLGFAGGMGTYEVASKRERRKEQGIYYTPLWVTNYIVRQTVGAFIEEREKRPDAIHEIKVLDLACGSGSFLIRAYDELLRWHARSSGRTEAHVFADERLPILHNSIFGVDLDPQAVQIARLNLLLRALAQRALLPSLADNVMRGNSLISGTPEELKVFFGDGWEEKHPFNWEERFPKVMGEGGFDIIVGNPPYVRIQTQDKIESNYFAQTYSSSTGNYDLYVLFLEKALSILKPDGRLGFILPNKFFQAAYGKGIRTLLSKNQYVERVIDFGDAQVFDGGTTYTSLLFLTKKQNKTVSFINAREFVNENNQAMLSEAAPSMIPSANLSSEPWLFQTRRLGSLKSHLDEQSETLQVVTSRIFQGLKTSADDIYILEVKGEERDLLVCIAEKREIRLEKGLLMSLIKGHEMRRYTILRPNKVIIFPYKGRELIDEASLARDWPRSYEYLLANKSTLEKRQSGAFAGAQWYQFGRNQALDVIGSRKLITPDIAAAARFSWDSKGEYYFTGGTAGGYGIIVKPGYRYEYVLGLCNSSLLDWYLQSISSHFHGGYFSYEARFIRQLPIRRIDFAKATDKALHDRLVALVERMLELQGRAQPLRGTGLTEEQDLLREIERVDREIDGVVYELYGLTEGERRLVEGETFRHAQGRL